MDTKHFEIEFRPSIPEGLLGLQELANDLYYGWNVEVRILFRRIDCDLWEACGHNPKLFLRRVSQRKLEDAERDTNFMRQYSSVLSAYHAYQELEVCKDFSECLDPDNDLVAYLCLEFGFHESLPIYSGGLGILAGDLCKAASDLAIPFIGVGLLYRQGYFKQQVDDHGNQIALYHPTQFDQLPITPCKDSAGEDLIVEVALPARSIKIKVWEALVGNIKLYFLDCDIPENDIDERQITHQLYGGGKENRILQEIVLGVGGVRALRALHLDPKIWHINEGHAAFSLLERCRENIDDGMSFTAAAELNASNTVFTTHTPVPAGHDIFAKKVIHSYFADFATQLGISFEQFMALGSEFNADEFNMTTLALNLSRYHNGVSRIHGGVASAMEAHMWPQVSAQENPIGYVTNGVHVSTFLAREWMNLLDMRFGDWRRELNNEAYWQCLDDIPAHRFWSLRRELKANLFSQVHERLEAQYRRIGHSEGFINRATQIFRERNTNTLVLGFARRFATYKRANLLFYDIERLDRLLNDPERPTLLLYAGKAHPEDKPGQDLIRSIHEVSRRPEFLGKIILVEDYDMVLARALVAGVDVWVNNPEYPMEASGTSGQKAGMNGVLNLSVLDGWWAEGYNGKNGWGITPHGEQFDANFRNHQEANEMLDLLEQEVLPIYFKRNGDGYSADWVQMAKESMKSIIPNFNSQRMLIDYINDYYLPAREKYGAISSDNGKAAEQLGEWKARVLKAWPGVSIRCLTEKPIVVMQGDTLPIEAVADLNGLSAKDVVVECVLSKDKQYLQDENRENYIFSPVGVVKDNQQRFAIELSAKASGKNYLSIRMYPSHELLCHPFEMGCMVWVGEN